MKRTKIMGWLVMAAALTFSACSGEDNMAGETTTTEPTAQTQATIHVTVGAGISDGATRSTVDYTGGTRTLQFTTGDKLWVRCEIGDAEGKILAGFLDIDAGSIASTTTGAGTPEEKTTEATSASFSGELKVYGQTPSSSEYGFDYTESSYDFGGAADVLAYCLSDLGEAKGAGSATATLVHSGTQAAFDNDGMHDDGGYARSTAADANALMASRLAVSGDYDAASQAFLLTAEAGQPILNCTIAGLKAGATYTMTYSASIDDGTYREHTTGSVATDASGTATFACFGGTRLYDGSQWVNNLYHRIRLTNAADAGDTYTVSIGQKVFEGKVYNVSRLWTSSGFVKTRVVNLTGMTNYYGAQNGDILTGTMPSDKELFIADGATVILRDATVNSSKYIGINCRDVTIILEGENTVSSIYSGINIYPGTLTIQGSGSLTVTGGGDYAGICGNSSNSHLVIKGGTIVAQGGTSSNYSGAGIGSKRDGQFGTITISGGDVTATGGANAAGIGCGSQGTCGDITISGGTVRATGGSTSGSGIGGTGDNGRCGNITISGGTVTATSNSAETPAIGNSTTNNGTCVTITSGITSVAMTSNSEYGTWKKVWYFLQDQTISIDGVNIPNYGNANIVGSYGTVGSVYDYSTKTWTLYK